jgi:hypothetical protein
MRTSGKPDVVLLQRGSEQLAEQCARRPVGTNVQRWSRRQRRDGCAQSGSVAIITTVMTSSCEVETAFASPLRGDEDRLGRRATALGNYDASGVREAARVVRITQDCARN